ncbi:Rad4-domain-containing protein [Coniophora puteana RWD-64-598 SS2]|uniref:Rad4-domain-containing protein n=1 Tax=Coniophora puteana (strain RWD-64-598) TaxID=741705 RepID=A0A5M3MPW5_CONPW|nr:Rad4-domain-containing protein [Coniophora puteana RWD-64-598 SS2]EIW81219.1 Rad4-domain-containing protein [Coniophora puteana RWD-64-598 SS2]
MSTGDAQDANSSSEEDFDWEEVDVPGQQEPELPQPYGELEVQLEAPKNIEITLPSARAKKGEGSKRQAGTGISHAERMTRVTCHKIHTVCMLANARVRNKWLNDETLQARLLSLVPMSLQDNLAIIHKSRVPERAKRGRMFESAVGRIATWWAETYFSVDRTGHIVNRTYEDVAREMAEAGNDEELYNRDDMEMIRSPKSLMKHLLMRRGSRDTSSQLFTALCRALDIPTRLVVSLQSVPWKTSSDKKKAPKKPSAKGKSKEKATNIEDESEDDEDMEPVDIPIPDIKGKGKAKATDEDEDAMKNNIKPRKGMSKPHVVKLRKSKSQQPRPPKPQASDPTTSPPVFWTEVFSRADSMWIAIDPIRGIIGKRQVFDPTPSSTSGQSKLPRRRDNIMLYVIALEEDGYGRDVTARYARDYTAKVAKVQGARASSGGRGRREWWERVIQVITRPYRLQRDDLEDDELRNHQLTEGMPTTLAGFKDHPLYVLSRHLKRDEVVDPPVELGKFRGDPVYARSSVVSLKTAENWMRQGRVIREGCQPMKMVKQRAMTIAKQREIEVAMERGHNGEEGEVLQGLYARNQTDLYKPPPIENGKVPKNDFGNIDLYVPSMLPPGGVHIPFKGVAKIARKLGFDFAEAVTGFEFRKRRAVPLIEGIVVSAENEAVIVEAFLAAEGDAEEKAKAKRLDQVHKRWVRLVQGLRIRQRLQAQYVDADNGIGGESAGTSIQVTIDQPQVRNLQRLPERGVYKGMKQPGGFLITADDVVEQHHLPKSRHRADPVQVDHVQETNGRAILMSESEVVSSEEPVPGVQLEDTVDVMGVDDLPNESRSGVPITMQALAEAAHAHKDISHAGPEELSSRAAVATVASGVSTPGSSAPTKKVSTRTARGKRKRASEGSDAESDKPKEDEPTPRKRRGEAAPAAATPPSGRVLRPRASKTASQLKEGKGIELAYRRAVAE